uniref:protein-histidine N-methyltransferase n=1 Tax=Meloidogyne incognita TaxID=6306 RepID=A0A914MA04_MELIC
MATNILKLKSGRKIYYSTKESIENKLISNKIKLNNLTDLENKVYEGGLKIWECSLDLCYFIDSMSFEGFNVLELGCGAGLPSILAALNGASSLTLQDFNDYVLEANTKINFQLNGIDLSKCSFVKCDWANCLELEGI